MKDFIAKPATIREALKAERQATNPFNKQPRARDEWEQQHQEIIGKLSSLIIERGRK